MFDAAFIDFYADRGAPTGGFPALSGLISGPGLAS